MHHYLSRNLFHHQSTKCNAGQMCSKGYGYRNTLQTLMNVCTLRRSIRAEYNDQYPCMFEKRDLYMPPDSCIDRRKELENDIASFLSTAKHSIAAETTFIQLASAVPTTSNVQSHGSYKLSSI